MTILFAAAGVFLAIHLLISGTRIRDGITAAIGEGPYMALFSLASIGVIVWMAMGYNRAQASGEDTFLYMLGDGVHHLGMPVVFLAFILGVPGLLSPNPTSVRGEGAAQKPETVRGVLRITRHPFLWGVVIWSAFHLAANGDEASVVFFGTFFVLALLGTFSIDAKRRRKLGAAWEGFAAKTSNIPFAAILAGRTKFSFSEYFDWRFLVAILLFVTILFAHVHLFGVSPFPGGWRPI
jgi:uncharacterized membrane protein